MSVEVRLFGRLGNNLFQYALGRIIAERFGMALNCHQGAFACHAEGGKPQATINATLNTLARFFPNAPLQLDGRIVLDPVESYEVMPGSSWRGQTVNLSSILQNQSVRQIRLQGWFQRFEYYAPYRNRIWKWFHVNLNNDPLSHAIRSSDVLVSIRRGADFAMNGWILPLSYYDDILSSLPELGQVYVCGTGVDDSIKRGLAKYNPIYCEGAPIEHFAFITKFRQIILSNSTFAWWAAFLSNATRIFAPRASDVHAYSFTGFEDVDLHMQEERYREIPFNKTLGFCLFERNPNSDASYDQTKRTLVLTRQNGAVSYIPISDHNREVLEWILKIRPGQPITIGEIMRRYDRADYGRLLKESITSGLLSYRANYLGIWENCQPSKC
jgi:hypothetical protein